MLCIYHVQQNETYGTLPSPLTRRGPQLQLQSDNDRVIILLFCGTLSPENWPIKDNHISNTHLRVKAFNTLSTGFRYVPITSYLRSKH